MRRLLWILAVALVVACLVYAAHAQERWPGQQPGVPRDPGAWDRANWTWQQHCWWFAYQLWNYLGPLLAGAIAAGGGALWAKKKRET